MDWQSGTSSNGIDLPYNSYLQAPSKPTISSLSVMDWQSSSSISSQSAQHDHIFPSVRKQAPGCSSTGHLPGNVGMVMQSGHSVWVPVHSSLLSVLRASLISDSTAARRASAAAKRTTKLRILDMNAIEFLKPKMWGGRLS